MDVHLRIGGGGQREHLASVGHIQLEKQILKVLLEYLYIFIGF